MHSGRHYSRVKHLANVFLAFVDASELVSRPLLYWYHSRVMPHRARLYSYMTAIDASRREQADVHCMNDHRKDSRGRGSFLSLLVPLALESKVVAALSLVYRHVGRSLRFDRWASKTVA